MVRTEAPEVVPAAAEHEDPPIGLRFRTALLAFVVGALIATGVYAAVTAFDIQPPRDPCARLVGLDRTVCEAEPVQPG